MSKEKEIKFEAALGKLEEIVFYDHPSVEARVRRAMEWKAGHPPTPGQ